ncbi:hypothetical protein BASA81_007231 [Batrachochytrium salamandrivorans]|nr:hypothetical protein BASA81_007231 [Batrachochytrium salamandrivorans]
MLPDPQTAVVDSSSHEQQNNREGDYEQLSLRLSRSAIADAHADTVAESEATGRSLVHSELQTQDDEQQLPAVAAVTSVTTVAAAVLSKTICPSEESQVPSLLESDKPHLPLEIPPAATVEDADDEYMLKPLLWLNQRTGEQQRLCIITQNINGPCPLISLCNALILRGDIVVHPDLASIKNNRMLELLGDYLLRRTARDSSTLQTSDQLTFERTMDDILVTLPSLQFGLDVNVHFSSVMGFELTSALCLFDMFDLRLVHGWICDPDDQPTYRIVAQKYRDYNRVVEAIVAGDTAGLALSKMDPVLDVSAGPGTGTGPGLGPGTGPGTGPDESTTADLAKHKSDLETTVIEGLTCSQFLASSAAQLTHYGLQLIEATVGPGELCVLFRNNHFSTMYKHPDRGLFVLVTDQGFAKEPSIVWESMGRVDGNTEFLDGLFRSFDPDRPAEEDTSISLLAANPLASDTENSDLALAISLQQEEERQQQVFIQQQQVANERMRSSEQARNNPQSTSWSPSRSNIAGDHRQRPSQKNNCVIQ